MLTSIFVEYVRTLIFTKNINNYGTLRMLKHLGCDYWHSPVMFRRQRVQKLGKLRNLMFFFINPKRKFPRP